MTDHCKDLREGRLNAEDLVGRRARLKEAANQFFTPDMDLHILSARKVHERDDPPGVFNLEFSLARKFMGRTLKLRPVAPEEFQIVEEE